jgi:hypothetical protein
MDQELFFPVLNIKPEFEGDELSIPPFRFLKRKWRTSTFDLATLATKHNLRLPYQLMDVFLSRVNAEVGIRATHAPDAMSSFRMLRMMLYLESITPFVCPFVTTYSVNDYSGINSRDSDTLREQLHPDLRNGFTSDKAKVTAFEFEPTFEGYFPFGSPSVDEVKFKSAVGNVPKWQALVDRFPPIRNLQGAATAATQMGSDEQSLLHLWCGLEGLFPTVTSEVNFKLSLFLAQLAEAGPKRRTYFAKVKKSYSDRSKISHGSATEISSEDWDRGWEIVLDTCRALLRRGNLPNEDALMADLLG